ARPGARVARARLAPRARRHRGGRSRAGVRLDRCGLIAERRARKSRPQAAWLLWIRASRDYLLAAIAAELAAMAADSAADAADMLLVTAAEAAMEASDAIVGGGVTTVVVAAGGIAGVTVVVSSFLLQPANATAATIETNSRAFFILVPQ